MSSVISLAKLSVCWTEIRRTNRIGLNDDECISILYVFVCMRAVWMRSFILLSSSLSLHPLLVLDLAQWSKTIFNNDHIRNKNKTTNDEPVDNRPKIYLQFRRRKISSLNPKHSYVNVRAQSPSPTMLDIAGHRAESASSAAAMNMLTA